MIMLVFVTLIGSFFLFSHGLKIKTNGFLSGLIQNKVNKAELVNLKKNELRELTKDCKNGLKATAQKRECILQLAKEIESLNPTKNIANDSKLNGSWKLLFTSNEGSSAGKLGPFLGQVVQDIDLSSMRYVNYVRLPFIEGALDATWDPKGSNAWIVKFLSINFRILNISVLKKDLKALGEWRLTYLDENLRILYAKSGKNAPENIYILSK